MRRATLIAGPTASGKSALALALAKQQNGLIINADALQVYDCWRVLSARPSEQEQAQAPHALYGFVPMHTAYSVGRWLKDLGKILATTDKHPIIVGGTGLYFRALTEGLAEIPQTPTDIRSLGNKMFQLHGAEWFKKELLLLDKSAIKTVDQQNPARLQRAWEVRLTTGTSLWEWHQNTPPPLLEADSCQKIVLNWQVDVLNARIDQRFDIMMETGAVEEVLAAMRLGYNPALPSGKALGAREISAALRGNITMEEATKQAKIATHQFAKRQRTWFRSRMKPWNWVDMQPNISLQNILMNLNT